MILARRVALNGVWLDEIDSRIVISGVEPGDGKENISATDSAAGAGQRIISTRRSTLDIVVRFKLLERGKSAAGMTERAALLEKVNGWARSGGYLTVNYKPDRRIYVVLAQAPGEGSLWDYAKEFTLTFRAYGLPYWEQESQTIGRTGTGNDGLSSIQVPGNALTVADAELQNMSGATINTAQIVIAGQGMWFNNLEMGGSEALRITHDNNGLISIKVGNRSAMALRTVESVDDFMLTPGPVAFGFTAQRACRLTVSCRGRFL